MVNLINKSTASENTPIPSESWISLTDDFKKQKIKNEISNSKLLDDFIVISCDDHGNVILKIEKVIPANERGVLLLKVEEMLKEKIDKSIVIWLEPVGDKSKLRNLRGIEIKQDK